MSTQQPVLNKVKRPGTGLATPAKPATQAAPPAVGAQLAKLREERGWSLDSLSQRAGVSKSMLSQIERAQANPTVAVVWRLANALGVPLLELLQPDKAASPEAAVTVVPAGRSPTLRTGDDLGELQILGPIETAGHFEWYHLKLKAGGALSSQPHEPGTREHLTVLSGTLEVSAGSAVTKVAAGETARYPADVSHSIRNPGRATATALLVVMHTD